MAKRNLSVKKCDAPNDAQIVRKSARLATVSQKSHSIKKNSVKRSAKKVTKTQVIAVTKRESVTPDLELKSEPCPSPSVFTNYTSSQVHHGFSHWLAPVPPAANNAVQSNTYGINSPTITSSGAVSQNRNRNVNNSQLISSSTQYTDPPSMAGSDNFLDFVMSGKTPEPNKTVEYGVQCEIETRAQCNDAATNTSPMEIAFTEFDLLDVIFLNRLADRLNVNRRTVMETSRQVLNEMIRLNDWEEPVHVELPSFDDEMMAIDADVTGNFYDYSDVVLRNYDNFTSPTESIISGSTPKSVLYYDDGV